MAQFGAEGWDLFSGEGMAAIGDVRRGREGELAVAAAAVVEDLVAGLGEVAR